MKFVMSSPDSFLFDRSEFKDMSRDKQIGLSVLALGAVGMFVGLFVQLAEMSGAL